MVLVKVLLVVQDGKSMSCSKQLSYDGQQRLGATRNVTISYLETAARRWGDGVFVCSLWCCNGFEMKISRSFL